MFFVMLGVAGAALAQTAPGAAANAGQNTVPNTDPGRTIHFAPPVLKPGIPTVWLVGDSTVRNGKGDGANN